jgi:hypothetical protein
MSVITDFGVDDRCMNSLLRAMSDTTGWTVLVPADIAVSRRSVSATRSLRAQRFIT